MDVYICVYIYICIYIYITPSDHPPSRVLQGCLVRVYSAHGLLGLGFRERVVGIFLVHSY